MSREARAFYFFTQDSRYPVSVRASLDKNSVKQDGGFFGVDMKTKLCPKCNTVKPVGDFGKNKSKRDGLTGYCRECTYSYYDEYNKKNPGMLKAIWTKFNNSPKKKAYDKKWNEENPEKVRAKKRKWESKNPNKIKAQSQRYYEKHKDDILASQRERAWRKTEKGKKQRKKWVEENKEKIIVANRNRKARIKEAEGSFTLEEWERLKKHYGNKCLCCGDTEKKLTMDHVVPIKLGGTNFISNIQPLCGSCNSSKGATIKDYRK